MISLTSLSNTVSSFLLKIPSICVYHTLCRDDNDIFLFSPSAIVCDKRKWKRAALLLFKFGSLPLNGHHLFQRPCHVWVRQGPVWLAGGQAGSRLIGRGGGSDRAAEALVLTFKNVQDVGFTLYGPGHFLPVELSTRDRKLFAGAVRSS